jgi:hypothetical protein
VGRLTRQTGFVILHLEQTHESIGLAKIFVNDIRNKNAPVFCVAFMDQWSLFVDHFFSICACTPVRTNSSAIRRGETQVCKMRLQYHPTTPTPRPHPSTGESFYPPLGGEFVTFFVTPGVTNRTTKTIILSIP